MSELTYELYPFRDNTIVVFGDRDKFGKIMKSLGARWNSRLKGDKKQGWTIPTLREQELIKICETFKREEQMKNMEKNKKSRKEQKKYHRAISSDEEQSPELQKTAVETYKKFSQPAKFRSPSLEPDDLSGSESEHSSVGLPSPNHFKPRHDASPEPVQRYEPSIRSSRKKYYEPSPEPVQQRYEPSSRKKYYEPSPEPVRRYEPSVRSSRKKYYEPSPEPVRHQYEPSPSSSYKYRAHKKKSSRRGDIEQIENQIGDLMYQLQKLKKFSRR